MSDKTTKPVNPLAIKINAFYKELGKVVIGYKDIKRGLIIALMSDGHVLLESMPGLAKTMLINTMQKAVGGSKSGRIQFNPDLKPNDVLGTRIFNPLKGVYEFVPGPILGCNFLLADELNRGIALTQSALLQGMQERVIDIPNVERQFLDDPFMVLATINPVEQEGTFTLPEAQLDRFMFKLIMGYVSKADEIKILENVQVHGRGATDKVEPVITVEEIKAIRKEVYDITADASPAIREYIVDLMRATRPTDPTFKKVVDKDNKPYDGRIAYGASPRLGIWVLKGAACSAWLDSRTFIQPDDVKMVFRDALRHRLILTQEAVFEGFMADSFVNSVLDSVAVVGRTPAQAKK